MMNEQGHTHRFENLAPPQTGTPSGAVGRDADVEGLALVNSRGQRAHGLFKRTIVPRPVGVEDVDVVRVPCHA